MSMEAILYAIIASVIYGLAGYLKNAPQEDFDVAKFLSTLLVAVLVGGICYITGVPISEANITEQLMAYTGLIVLIQQMIKALMRRL